MVNLKLLTAEIAGMFGTFALALFLGAGTVFWPGPYRYVRHPMYAASIVFIIGTTLMLGSWYGLLLGFILIVGVALRAVQEERTLRTELSGYDEYMSKVKYRLIP